MGFKWLCPECEKINTYGGSKTKDANSTCSNCGKTMRIWKYREVIEVPTPSNNFQQISNILPTEYKTMIKASKRTEEINLDYWEDMANWAINTIKNKPSVKTGKGQYFRNVGRWSEQLQIIKRLKEGVEK